MTDGNLYPYPVGRGIYKVNPDGWTYTPEPGLNIVFRKFKTLSDALPSPKNVRTNLEGVPRFGDKEFVTHWLVTNAEDIRKIASEPKTNLVFLRSEISVSIKVAHNSMYTHSLWSSKLVIQHRHQINRKSRRRHLTLKLPIVRISTSNRIKKHMKHPSVPDTEQQVRIATRKL